MTGNHDTTRDQKTALNRPGRDSTALNIAGQRERTALNTERRREATALNQNTALTLENIREGSVVGEYTVTARVNESGEARLYSCTDAAGNACMLKVYLREMHAQARTAHDEIVSSLKAIPKGVVKILATGLIQEHVYDVMPYYSNGSLADRLKQKLFTEEEIEKEILPKMVRIFRNIHNAGIYHSDIKPENIVYDENGRDLVLIDFGVSVKTETNERTALRTTVGGTTDYQAHETYSGIILPESDYYSLGITLYTLMYGKPPSAHLTNELDVQRWKLLGVIPKPDAMSERMHTLLKGLTYSSLVNRDDRRDPYVIRWLAEEVEQWLKGNWPSAKEAQAKPGESWEQGLASFNVRFAGKAYTSIQELIYAMAADWDRGKNFLFRTDGSGLLAILARAGRNDPGIAALEKEIKAYIQLLADSRMSEDAGFFDFIYKYAKGTDVLFWNGTTYRTMDSLAQAVSRAAGSYASGQGFYELLSEDLLKNYLMQKNRTEKEEEVLEILNKMVTTEDSVSMALNKLAFVLADDKSYKYAGDRPGLKTVADLKQLLAEEGMKRDLPEMEEFCKHFMNATGRVNEKFKAWQWYHNTINE